MEEVRGPGRGSFIWGRSVHNTQIERLWYDVTHGFGKKWKVFFLDLEANHCLNPTRPGHIWLLHHLFLSSINRDAQDWAEAWNSHQLTICRQRERSPRNLFTPEEEEIEDINEYGVDWEVTNEPELIAHLLENNPHERTPSNPLSHQPVLCEPPDCPFTQLQLHDEHLSTSVDLFSRNMNVRRVVWVRALDIARRIQQGDII
ncbi:hypothetical protein B0H10DRAFT_2341862 [Mycena sp. CBHHK59/15]|nr:hypothetical protein B0H10DRAFT_2341862 [Mycena sp. CBHHK59/15]